MDNSNTDTNSHILSDSLQEQAKRIQEATTRVMPSTRPLKKRRIVSIEPDDVAVSEPPRTACKGKKKKAQQPRTAKKQKKGFVSPSPPSSPITVMNKSVTWNEQDGNTIHLTPDSCFNHSDLWYTREDYKEFLMDRLQTIKSHRDGNNSCSYCIRGLEIFQDNSTSEQFQTKKKFHHSMVKMEQIRQTLLGTKDLERFRDLLKHQSDLALQRAQELAAQDQREIYPFRAYADAARDIRAAVSSYSNMERLSNLMKSVYGSASPNDGSNSSLWNTNTPNPVLCQQQKSNSFETHAESSGASVVSDVSSTMSSSSNASSSESSTSNGQSLFSDECIRKLQERSMRRLMGIYQNGNNDEGEGAGAEEVKNETKNLFRFAKRDSLLGMSSSTSDDTTNTPSQNSVLAAAEEVVPSPQEQLLEILRHRQLLREQQQQGTSSEDSTPSLQEQILDMVHRRQLLEERQQLEEERQQLQQQQERMQLQQQEQQHASSEDATPFLQEQLLEILHRRQLMSEHHHQQQQEQRTSSIMGALRHGMGGDGSNSTSTNLIEKFLIQQQHHHQEHQNKMQLALEAMNASRFPIRRDTLSHVRTDTTNHHDTASEMNHPPLPWNVTSMA